jgi:hypothetical protein
MRPARQAAFADVHVVGFNAQLAKQTSIDPLKVARKFWKHTRVNGGRIRRDQGPRGVASEADHAV